MRSLTQAIACAGFILAASQASAAVINLEPPVQQGLGHVYSQDGFTFTNSSNDADAYINWKAYGSPQYDADNPGSDLMANYPFTTNTLTRTGGGTFAIAGLDLANGYATAPSGSDYVVFTFNFADGTSQTFDNPWDPAVKGFQHFAFNPATYSNLTSFVFSPGATTNSDDTFLQFNHIDVDATVSAVPLPASLPMFASALLALGGLGFGLSRRAGRGAAAA